MRQGNPRFLAVEQVGAVGLLDGDAGHGVVVGAGAGFGDGSDGNAGALDVVHHVHDLLLLLFIAELNNVHDGVEVGLEGKHAAGVLVELFHEHYQGELFAGDAAHFFGQAQVHEAQLAECHCGFQADVMVYLVCLLYRFGREVLFGVLLCAGDEQLLIGREFEVHRYSP